MRERDLVRIGDLVGYYDDKGEFVVVADCSLTDADMDRYSVQVQNGEGYYNSAGRYVSFIDYDYHSEDEYY